MVIDKNEPVVQADPAAAALSDALPAALPNPIDPLGVGKAALEVWQALLTRPQALTEAQLQFASGWLGVAARSLGTPGAQPKPLIEPAANDSRFRHPAWTESPIFDAIKQGYLLATKALLDGIDLAEGVDDETKQRVKFFTKQFCDAMSPTNVPFLNPAVIDETVRSGGANLQRGAENMLEDLRDNAGRPALVDKKAFSVGKNVATSQGSVVYRNDLIELIQYAPSTETVFERPLIITPPWINKFYILDLQPANSLIKFAVDSGVQTFVVSWRNPDASFARVGWEDYLERGPLSAARVASAITDSHDVNLIGYCIGGTLTAEMLAYLARTGETLVNAVTFLAALVDFSEAGDLRAFLSDEAVAYLDKKMDEDGILEGAEMADTFNMLRANDLIWNVAVNRYLLGKDAPAFDLLYWNSDATRLPAAMHKYYLRHMYLNNDLIAPDVLEMRGVPIDLRTVKNDVYTVASREDHIAPWRAVYRMTQLFSGDTRFRLAHSGHIAGIVNPPASGKGHYYAAPSNPPTAEEWLALAQRNAGSWWSDWQSWLGERSGERIPTPKALGNKRYSPLEPAPGTYVLQKS
ncbi:MAG TPA: class I poly(R)-hydroxyalkanoic acid synthase [Candidatus Baltobacteraceae bacterium]|nr:class I poly(R)-hydroxyalkanoic acid synthase [Candidatus Baltobacteraceae bacterium]